MSITKLKTPGPWSAPANDLTRVGPHLVGRRIITGMLTGSVAPPAPPPPPVVARIPGTRPPTSK
jgi:hypothetical protein